MENQFLKELTDFTDLRRKHDDFNTISSKQSAMPNDRLDFDL